MQKIILFVAFCVTSIAEFINTIVKSYDDYQRLN